MDAASNYSAGAAFPDISIESEIQGLGTHWISQFWSLTENQFD